MDKTGGHRVSVTQVFSQELNECQTQGCRWPTSHTDSALASLCWCGQRFRRDGLETKSPFAVDKDFYQFCIGFTFWSPKNISTICGRNFYLHDPCTEATKWCSHPQSMYLAPTGRKWARVLQQHFQGRVFPCFNHDDFFLIFKVGCGGKFYLPKYCSSFYVGFRNDFF